MLDAHFSNVFLLDKTNAACRIIKKYIYEDFPLPKPFRVCLKEQLIKAGRGVSKVKQNLNHPATLFKSQVLPAVFCHHYPGSFPYPRKLY